MQQRRLQAPVVRRGPVEPVPLAQQVPQRDRPGPRRTRPERHLPGQPVELHLRGVQTRLVQPSVRHGAHQEAQRRQIGPLGPRLFGEPAPHLGGTLGRRRMGR
ncbi:hypothetical protein JRC61_00500 [Streptomyces sp. CL12-4]|nr:hypothetical protein [Streptomyces sp. CL12-4]